jgi:ABC-type dipeptide/oligopeptide/nickel transport system permease subunit
MRTHTAWKRALRTKSIWFSFLVILIFGLVAVLAPWLAPHDPYEWGLDQSDLPPAWVQNAYQSGRAEFPLGTDLYGRDVLSRLIYGTRTAFFLVLLAVPLAALIGTIFGLISGYVNGRLDTLLMLFTDIVQSLPGIMFMVMIILLFRSLLDASWFNGLITLVIGFAAIGWVSLARVIRISVMQLKTELFVEAAVSLGASHRRIILRHLLPNVQHIILAWIINNVTAVILLEAFLGYIGVGVTSTSADNAFTVVSWGGMFYAGRFALSRNPLMLIVPSLCILLLSMSFIFLADFLRNLSRPAEG